MPWRGASSQPAPLLKVRYQHDILIILVDLGQYNVLPSGDTARPPGPYRMIRRFSHLGDLVALEIEILNPVRIVQGVHEEDSLLGDRPVASRSGVIPVAEAPCPSGSEIQAMDGLRTGRCRSSKDTSGRKTRGLPSSIVSNLNGLTAIGRNLPDILSPPALRAKVDPASVTRTNLEVCPDAKSRVTLCTGPPSASTT